MIKEKLRLDKYLWAIRVFKTRSLAADACDKGKVKFKGVSAKPSKPVSLGDEYDIKTDARRWIIVVTGLLHNRLQFSEAVNYYLDKSPQEVKDTSIVQASAFHTGKRMSKQGRPTKKQKRDLDDFFTD